MPPVASLRLHVMGVTQPEVDPFLHPANEDGPTAEEVTQAVNQHFSEVLPQAVAAVKSSSAIDSKMLRDWHHALFGDLFPEHTGRFRSQARDLEWPWSDDLRTRNVRVFVGVPAADVSARVQQACDQCNRILANWKDRQASELQAAKTSGWLYARIVRVQPFEGGNEHVAYLAMAVVLSVMGFSVPAVNTLSPSMREKLAPAMPLRGNCTIEPFASELRSALAQADRSSEVDLASTGLRKGIASLDQRDPRPDLGVDAAFLRDVERAASGRRDDEDRRLLR